MNTPSRRRFLSRSVGAVLGGLALTAEAQENAVTSSIGQEIRTLILRNVTVVDVTGKPSRPGMDIVIQRRQIQALERTGSRERHEGAVVKDLSGKYVIPGLWDMHVHSGSTAEGWPPLTQFIANGVLGARVMLGTPLLRQFRDEIASGKRVGPRLMVASPVLDEPGELQFPSGWRYVTNADQARSAVQASIEEGADFIKVYDSLSRSCYFAIADETRKLRIPFVGHPPVRLSLLECSEAGQKSVEHVLSMLKDFSKAGREWKRAAVAATRMSEIPPEPATKTVVETFDESLGDEILTAFQKNGTWICPTLTVARMFSGDPELSRDSRLKYVSAEERRRWAKRIQSPVFAPEAVRRQRFEQHLRLIRAFSKAGAGILAGTDTPIAYCLTGFGLHDELKLLVRAGLTPAEALRASTLGPTRFFGLSDSLGTVEPGKLAELVVLDGNPLADIGNTQAIHAVITAGRAYWPDAIGRMLTEFEATAAR